MAAYAVGDYIQQHRTLALCNGQLPRVCVYNGERVVAVYALRMERVRRYARRYARHHIVAHGLAPGLASHAVEVVVYIEYYGKRALSLRPEQLNLIHGG